MINKRITLSALSILVSLSLMAGATYAYFTDTASSSNNTFSAGTFDLQLQDNNESFRDNVSASFVSPANWAPNDTFTSYLCFKNNGTVPIQQILFNLNSDNAEVPGNDLDQHVYVESIELGNVTTSPSACGGANDFGTDGLFDFTSLFEARFGNNEAVEGLLTKIDGTNKTQDDLLDGAENAILPGELYKLRVQWKFNPLAPTLNVAGKTLDLDLNFTATQDEQS